MAERISRRRAPTPVHGRVAQHHSTSRVEWRAGERTFTSRAAAVAYERVMGAEDALAAWRELHARAVQLAQVEPGSRRHQAACAAADGARAALRDRGIDAPLA